MHQGTLNLRSRLKRRMEKTYPKCTFKELLVVAVDWCDDLQELQCALLIVEIGNLLERLLNQLPKSFSLKRGGNSKNRPFKNVTGLIQQKNYLWLGGGSGGEMRLYFCRSELEYNDSKRH